MSCMRKRGFFEPGLSDFEVSSLNPSCGTNTSNLTADAAHSGFFQIVIAKHLVQRDGHDRHLLRLRFGLDVVNVDGHHVWQTGKRSRYRSTRHALITTGILVSAPKCFMWDCHLDASCNNSWPHLQQQIAFPKTQRLSASRSSTSSSKTSFVHRVSGVHQIGFRE